MIACVLMERSKGVLRTDDGDWADERGFFMISADDMRLLTAHSLEYSLKINIFREKKLFKVEYTQHFFRKTNIKKAYL